MPREPLGIVPSQTLFLALYTFPLEILTTTPLGRPILLPIVQMQKLKPEQLSQLSKATQLSEPGRGGFRPRPPDCRVDSPKH